MQPDRNLKCTCRCTCRSSRSNKPSRTSDTLMESIVNQTNPAATEPVQLKEKHRLIAHLEQQSHQINLELKRLQLEGFLTNAAIQAMRKQASNPVTEQSVHHQLVVPHSTKQPDDDSLQPVVCNQHDQHFSAAHQVFAASDPPATNTNNASRRGCSKKCYTTEQQDHIRPASHSGHAGYSTVNQELTELRSRQTLLADRIQSLQHARSQLLSNLNQLLQLEESADSPKLLKVNKPLKATCDGSSNNYEYLYNASTRTNSQPSTDFGDLYCDHGRSCRVLLSRTGVDNKQQPGRESSFRLNDQECQTDFPVKVHHNALYEHVSDSGGQINDCATGDNSPHLPNKAPIKPIFDLGVQSTTVSALAAVAAVAAASFLSKTMNQVHGVTEAPNPRGSSDQPQAQQAEKQERRQGVDTCTPVLKRVLPSDKTAGKVNPMDCLTQSSQSSAQPLPTFVVQDEPKSVSLSLDNTSEPKSLRGEMSENKPSSIYQNSKVPPVEKGIDEGTPSAMGLCCGIQLPYDEEIYPSMPENTIFGKKDGSLSEFDSSPRVCSKFSERIQLARNYVDRLYGPGAPKNLIEENAYHVRPTSRRCSPEAVAECFYDSTQNYADVLDNNCCNLPQCQRRFEYNMSKPENSFYRNSADGKILTESTQVPSTSTNTMKPTPIQVVKPALRSINAADSSGFDTGSPSDSDDWSAKSAQILSQARMDTYRNTHNFATDSAQTEQQEKGKKPKGVLISESSKERRQRELQKNNCPQRTVVWEDELYNGSYQKSKEENPDSVTGNNIPAFNLIDCEQRGSSSVSHMNVSLIEEDFNKRPGMFPPGGCEDPCADPRATDHEVCVEGQINCEKTINRVIRRSLPAPGKTPAVKNLR